MATPKVPLYVLNVTYPLIDDEIIGFCKDKEAVLVVEEGQPDYLEQALRRHALQGRRRRKLAGKGFLPMAGEYTGQGDARRRRRILPRACPDDALRPRPRAECADHADDESLKAGQDGADAPARLLHRLSRSGRSSRP